MKKIALLSCDSLEGMVTDEHLLIEELKNHGYEVTMLSWTVETNWRHFDAAIIRTTWDYALKHKEFIARLRHIASETRLFNSLEVVEWNIHKKYLQELASKGIETVPTQFFSYPGRPQLDGSWDFPKYIVKPAISAGSFKTVVVTHQELQDGSYLSTLHEGDWMVQPFLEEIKKGEISLHYFNKNFSHAIIKVPKEDDFRVQEEFGGNIQNFDADEALIALGKKIVDTVPHDLLYARVDVVPVKDKYLLMELELIEPSLYFRKSPEAPKNFVRALQNA